MKAEIAFAEGRLREILSAIRNAAGRSATGEEFDEEREGYGGLEDEVGEGLEEEGALESDRS